jgi:hypothetical protein
MISLKLVNNVATPNYFIFTFVKKNKIAKIILALQMAKATSSLKIEVEVSCFNFVPCMAIMFLVHFLHLTTVTVESNKRGEFKQNITIKCGQNARNSLNTKIIIVQISQLRAGMYDKGHCPKIVNNIKHKWSSRKRNFYIGIWGIN